MASALEIPNDHMMLLSFCLCRFKRTPEWEIQAAEVIPAAETKIKN